MFDTQHHEMPDGTRIAFSYQPGEGPALVFLPGYMSDMAGGKATALYADAREKGRAILLLDYSGCGESSGNFADGTLSKWRDEVLALIEAQGLNEVLLVGSSMGGWLMLLVGEALMGSGRNRLAGMIGIASAPDFTDWGRSEDEKAQLGEGTTIYDPNPYGPEPTPMHARFFGDGQAQLRLGQEIAIDCPVRLIHGQRDADVPWEVSLKLARWLRSDEVKVVLVKDGDHRLSREQDIALLKAEVDAFY